jgi:hypothetical protein
VSARTAFASVAIFAWVLVAGSIADIHEPGMVTAYALGMLTVAVPFVAAAAFTERDRG